MAFILLYSHWPSVCYFYRLLKEVLKCVAVILSFSVLSFFLLLLLAVRGLCRCAGLSPVAASRGSSSVRCAGSLAVASSAVEQVGSRALSSVVATQGLSSCGSRALEHRLSSCDPWA